MLHNKPIAKDGKRDAKNRPNRVLEYGTALKQIAVDTDSQTALQQALLLNDHPEFVTS